MTDYYEFYDAKIYVANEMEKRENDPLEDNITWTYRLYSKANQLRDEFSRRGRMWEITPKKTEFVRKEFLPAVMLAQEAIHKYNKNLMIDLELDMMVTNIKCYFDSCRLEGEFQKYKKRKIEENNEKSSLLSIIKRKVLKK